MRFKGLYFAIIVMVCTLLATLAFAGIPRTISYQGYLKGSGSGPVNTPTKLTFSLYSSNPHRNNPLWSETQNNVDVKQGVYSVELGTVTAITAPFDIRYWLGVTANGDPEMTPLQPLSSVPYSFRAGCIPGDGVECYSGPAATRNVTPCKTGKRVCAPNGNWGPCADEQLPQLETGNGIDDDCDGVIDNSPCTLDADCSASQFCGDAQKCLPKLQNGAACSREAQCTVHCTNGICSDLLGCDTPADCGAAPPCSSTTCNNHVCGTQFEPAGTQVTDQTVGDCRSNQCNGSGAIISVAYDADLPASDGNDCTQDLCSNGTPTYQYSAAGTTCNGSGVCNGTGSCVECLSGSDCPSGICSQGNCIQPSCADTVKNGAETDVDCGGPDCTKCSDSKSCSFASDCQSGVCTGGICRTPTCTDGVKNGSETAADCGGICSTKCSTGLACSTSSDCVSGNCTAGICTVNLCSGVTCTALDQCHTAGMCNPATGVCSNPAKADSTACDDGNACTQTDICQAGICSGVNPVTCAPQDQCHDAGSCNPDTGVCSSPNKADGTACYDDNACTQTDYCQAGTCIGSNPVICAALDQCYSAGSCDAASGICTYPYASSGTACNQNGGKICDGAGICVECVMADDCPITFNQCATSVCTANSCGIQYLPSETPCTQNGGTKCDGLGSCIQ